ncbi:MAG: rSAM/selenodomain-associated transferase 2 [Algoriphagus sp.]
MLSIIIPTYNEVDSIEKCLTKIQENLGEISYEIILADSPHSTDALSKLAAERNCVYVQSKKGGRNFQMNYGAKLAEGNMLYFVHADVLVNKDFVTDIKQAVCDGYDMAAYRSEYSRYPHPLLYLNAFFTRFPMIWCRGGDQTLFIKKEVFQDLNGFCEKHSIMEDYDILIRAKKRYKFKVIPKTVLISSRKYEKNGYWKVQKANFMVMRKWQKNEVSPSELLQTYKRLLD